MIGKKLLPPLTQRTFANAWGELDYMYKKVRSWLYVRQQRTRAGHYADRLRHILSELPENGSAIIREEGFALLYELEHKTDQVIIHRQRPVHLMPRLHREAASAKYAETTRAYMP